MNIVETVDLLNDFLATDERVINFLFNMYVETNNEFADHKRSVVNSEQEVSILGIINSIVIEDNRRIVCVRDDKTGKILYFKIGEGYDLL